MMSVRRVIEFFSTFTKVPVLVEDLVEQILEMGLQDDIRLIPMDVSPDILLGMLVRYRTRSRLYDEQNQVALIFYNENVDEKMQRLICCKELMHLFDGVLLSTKCKEDLNTLIVELTHIGNLASPLKFSPATLMDHIGIWLALAVLFPHEMRDDWIKAHNSGKMSVADISREFAIPTEYIPLLLSKNWESIRETMLQIGTI